MENRFPRITSDLMVNAGLPSIRDTGIAAFIIVHKRIMGQSLADVLSEYPILEIEDIEEAESSVLTSMFSSLMFELKKDTHNITTIAHILKDSDEYSPTSDEKSLIPDLTRYAERLMATTNNFASLSGNYAREFGNPSEMFTLNSLITTIGERFNDIVIFELNSSETSVPLLGRESRIAKAVEHIVTYFSQQTIIRFKKQDSQVRVILRNSIDPDETTDRQRYIDRMEEAAQWPNSHLALGTILLVKTGLKPSIQLDSTEMTYQFDLPMFKSDETNNV